MKENNEVARRDWKIASNTRNDLENEIGEIVITKNKSLNYQYIEEDKLIGNKYL